MATPKYIVKRAAYQSAKRNPYRPSQKMRRGPWVQMGTFDNVDAALVRANELAKGGGLYDVGVFYRGERIAKPNEYTGTVALAAKETVQLRDV
jgi:hypothetical protein